MGHIFKFHTDVDTDQIIASQYLLFPTIDEMILPPRQRRGILSLPLRISAAALPENRPPAF